MAECKTRVALEAIKGLKPINEIASLYEVHPNQVSTWKKQFLEKDVNVFSKPNKSEEKQKEQETDNLYKNRSVRSRECVLKKKVASNTEQLNERRKQIEWSNTQISISHQRELLTLSCNELL